jgi:hypothetical protein
MIGGLAAVCLSVIAPSAASGEVGWPTPTTQAQAMEATFLLDPAFPPVRPSAACLVDSGFDPAAADDFAPGQVVTGSDLQGAPTADADPGHHGTTMARIAVAAANGVGMVGLWPGAQIAVVRAIPEGQSSFPFVGYRRGIEKCLRFKQTGQVPVTVISLALGTTDSPDSTEDLRLRDAIARARRDGVPVLAAAGNSGTVERPASEDGVLAVGAARAVTSDPCEFSPEGPGVDVLAAGCDLQEVDREGQPVGGAGTSQATTLAAVATAAALAFADATPPFAELEAAIIGASARTGQLSVPELFGRVGARIPPRTSPPSTPVSAPLPVVAPVAEPPATAPAPIGKPRLRRPLVRLRWSPRRRRDLGVTVHSHQDLAGQQVVRLQFLDARGARVGATRATVRSRFVVRPPTRARRLAIALRDRSGRYADAPPLTLRLPARARRHAAS